MSVDDTIASINLDLVPSARNEILQTLEREIDWLINNNFDKLVQLLYRIDISEQKLKDLLHQDTSTNAATIIAELIFDRQLQKLRSRDQFRTNNDIPPSEEW